MRRVAMEKLKYWAQLVLHTKDSPERTSLAFAIGVFIALLPPVPYLHTLLALVIAFAFRLNRLAVLVGAYINSPLTMAPVLVLELTIGLACLGGGDVPDITWRHLSTWEGWKFAVSELQPLIVPLLLGSVILALAGSIVAYFLVLTLITRYRRASQAVPLQEDASHSAYGGPGEVVVAGVPAPEAGGTPAAAAGSVAAVDTPKNPS